MMELFQVILARVAVAGITAGIAMTLAKDGALREVVRIACGLLIILAFFHPLAAYRFPILRMGDDSLPTAEVLERENIQTMQDSVSNAIAKSIERHAKEEGFSCTIMISMAQDEDGVLQVARLTAYYRQSDAARIDELRALIMQDCGVPEERMELVAR